jgi:sporulation and cell division protein SsgA
MDTRPVAVDRSLVVELLDASGASTQLDAGLHYDLHDPFAVTAEFRSGVSRISWVFSRDLLAEGLFTPCGDGDVCIWPFVDPLGNAAVVIQLSAPDGEALLRARSSEVCEFIQASRQIVAPGTESELVDLDSVIANLLGGV